MLDPITTTALATVVTGLANGATGEAGRQVWGTLVSTVRDWFDRDSAPAQAVAELEGPPVDRADAERVASVLADAAEQHPQFAERLGAWMQDARRITTGDHNVSNEISGNAHIQGPVVQTRDVYGSINFGSSNT